MEKAIREAAEKIAASAAPVAPPPPEPEPIDPGLALRLDALRAMQQDPKYANRNLETEYTEYLKKLNAYEASYLTANPDAKFELEAPEHEVWREKNEPEIAEEEIRDAEVEVRTLRRIDQRDSERAQANFSTTLAEQARTDATQAATDLLSFADGKPYTSVEELKKADWLAGLVARNYLPLATGLSTAITTLLTPGSPVPYDPSKQEHREVAKQVHHYEEAILKLPPAQRLDGQGRLYVPEKDYVRLPPAERARTWTFRYSPVEMRALVLNELSQIAKKDYLAQKADIPKAAFDRPTEHDAPVASNVPAPPPRPPAGGSGPGTSPAITTPPATRAGSFWT